MTQSDRMHEQAGGGAELVRGAVVPLVVLDTNCFIAAVSPADHAHDAVTVLLTAGRQGRIRVGVSLHSVHELEQGVARYGDEALVVARQFEQIPYLPLGSFKELLGTWKDLAGTWNDAKANHDTQLLLAGLAKSGNDLRDRGAFLDARRAAAVAFVTSDRQLVAPGPASRIKAALGLEPLTPAVAAARLAGPPQMEEPLSHG